MKDLPFTIYDILVYVMSGAVTVLSWDYFVGYRWYALHLDSSLLITFYGIVSYICGHVVSHISSAVLESIFVKRFLGEPVTLLTGSSMKRGIRAKLFPGYFRSLPAKIEAEVLERASVDGYSESLGIDFFLYAYAMISRQHEVQARLDLIRNQYGFARSMSVSLALGSLPVFLASGPALLGVIMCMTSCLLLYRYLKFFRQYSFEVLIRYLDRSIHP